MSKITATERFIYTTHFYFSNIENLFVMSSCHSTKIPATRNSGLMAKNAELTVEERNSILTLRAACLTVRGFTQATKRSVVLCSNVLSAQPNLNKPSRRESKLKISERDRRHIIRLISPGDLSAAKLKGYLKLTCRVRTIQRVLKSVDWLSYKKASSMSSAEEKTQGSKSRVG